MNKHSVTELFEVWNQALQTNEPKQIASLYAEDAILLPTVSKQVRHSHAEIEDYFLHFLAKGPNGELVESNVRVFDELAINSGIYEFSFKDGTNVAARFTFVYQNQGNEWKIIEHHSSQMPA